MVMTEEEKRKRLWKRIIVGLVIWFFVLPLVAMGAFAIIHYRHERARPVQKIAPDLKGLDLKSAEAKAREVGCSVQQMGTRWDLPGTPGTIVEQIPAAGEAIPLDFPIGVVMSIEDPDKAFWEEKRKRVH
jgi:beta-lactam-binding protein with PASTA domain